MFKLPIRTWILNAAAVFSGPHGAVTRQAEQSGCSRQTVYQHARKVEQTTRRPSRTTERRGRTRGGESPAATGDRRPAARRPKA